MNIKKIIKSKKIVALVLVCILSFSIVGCSNSSVESSSQSQSTQKTTESKKVDSFIEKGYDEFKKVQDDEDELTKLMAKYMLDIDEYVEDKTQFDSDENMEDILYKGAFLEKYGEELIKALKDDMKDSEEYEISQQLNEIGKSSIDMVKDVYEGTAKHSDNKISESTEKLKEALKKMYE